MLGIRMWTGIFLKVLQLYTILYGRVITKIGVTNLLPLLFGFREDLEDQVNSVVLIN
jgi:hypothetical protein